MWELHGIGKRPPAHLQRPVHTVSLFTVLHTGHYSCSTVDCYCCCNRVMDTKVHASCALRDCEPGQLLVMRCQGIGTMTNSASPGRWPRRADAAGSAHDECQGVVPWVRSRACRSSRIRRRHLLAAWQTWRAENLWRGRLSSSVRSITDGGEDPLLVRLGRGSTHQGSR